MMIRTITCLRLLALLTAISFACLGQVGPTSWSDYGGRPDSSHFTPLTQINKRNVSQLRPVWTYPTRDNLGYVFNPVVVGKVMYVLARNNSLVALNAATGEEIWIHSGLQGIASRGINYWESKDGKERRLIFQIHQQLQAIDAATGKSILTFGNNGFVDLREGLGRPMEQIFRVQSNTPGKVFEDLILMGSAPGESFLAPPGDLRAFDVRTGKLVWQFHTVPRPGEYGYSTWPKDAWKYIGGVNTWGEVSIDEKRGIAYFPTGSATYDFYGADRKGANLFSDCLIALDARTGKRLWHFQMVHHDLWDYDNVAAPQLITVKRGGKTIDAVAQAGKTGFLYVFDRVTGKPLWPIQEKPVPKSDMPGEQSWATQPYPSAPPPFGRQKFTADDINPYVLSAEERAAFKARVEGARNEGLFTPPGFRDTIQMPGNRGGSNWATTSANPDKGLVFVSNLDAPAILKMSEVAPGFGGVARGGDNPGQQAYQRNCATCHGDDRTGGIGPSLVDIGNRAAADVLRSTIQNGAGQMPGFGNLSEADVTTIIQYLGSPTAVGPGPAQSQAELLSGAVVASGGAPAGQGAAGAKLSGAGPFGAMAGPPYPADAADAPKQRYYTNWNVMYNLGSPPWTSLVAYDLNQGTIKWKIPLGDDPALAAQGIRGTGIRQEQRGILTTPTGLVFVATSDGKLRAIDEDDGKELWNTDLPGGNRAIPAMFEVNGKQYLAVSATTRVGAQLGGVIGGPAPPPLPAEAPGVPVRGYVVFALPDGAN